MKLHNIFLSFLISLCTVSTSVAASISLEDCIQNAKMNNPYLKTVSWDSQIATENIRQAKVSKYPRVDGQAGYTLQKEPQAVKMGGQIAETQEPDFAFAGISATYTLYDFGIRDARISKSDAQSNAVSESFLSIRSDVTLQVIEAYFRILEAERLIQAAIDEVTQITEHRRVVEVLLQEGVVTKNDLLQAEVRLASSKLKELSARNRLENSWLVLNYLTGASSDFRGELDGKTVVSGVIIEKKEGLTSNRHDIKAQYHLLEAGEFEIKENNQNYMPEIFTRLGIDYVQNDKVREQAILSATIGIKINLFDGFAADAAHERAVKVRSKQMDAIRYAEQNAKLEIATSKNDATVAQKRIEVSEAAIRQSEENLRINKERYQERIGIASEVLDAQTLVTQSKTDYYRALYDYQTAIARLQKATGEL